MDPPYVYNVFKDDLVGFVEAIEDAIANPIDRFELCHHAFSVTGCSDTFVLDMF